MKIFLSAVALIAFAGAAEAQSYGYGSNSQNHHVGGYSRQDGTYVQPHYQTNPNRSTFDNYDTRGNVNPYNGHVGTRSPY